jgi:peptidoglycan lytic transglycosylase A
MLISAVSLLTGCQEWLNEELTFTKVSLEELLPDPSTTKSSATPLSSSLEETEHAFRRSCQKIVETSQTNHPYYVVCQHYLDQSPVFREFLQENFDLFLMVKKGQPSGLLTGYFQPELQASPVQTPVYRYPVYKRPVDLIVIENLGAFNAKAQGIRIAGTVCKGTLKPYFTRQQIDQGALEQEMGQNGEHNVGQNVAPAEVIAWVQDPYDLFFMHIQGSGALIFEDGTMLQVAYDGTNGYPYTAIGKLLIERGELDLPTLSMQTIKQWLRDHPEQAFALMHHNQSYVFFKPLTKGTYPCGAQAVELTPHVSLAVDPDFIPLGSLVWIQADHPTRPTSSLNQLMVAQDVGGAIKGPLRGDYFWGRGLEAANNAGPMKSSSHFYIFVPKLKQGLTTALER